MTYLASTSIFSCLISSPTIPCGGKHGTYIHITYKSVYSNNGPNISQTNRHDSSRMVSILPKWRQDVVKGRHTSGGSSHIPRHLGVLPGVHHGRLNQNAIGCKEDFLNHQNSTYSLYRFIAMYTVLYVYMNIYIYTYVYIIIYRICFLYPSDGHFQVANILLQYRGSNDRWWPSPHSPQRSRCCEPACEERQKQRISLFCCQRTRYSPSIPNNRLEPLSNFRRSNMKQKPSISMQLP